MTVDCFTGKTVAMIDQLDNMPAGLFAGNMDGLLDEIADYAKTAAVQVARNVGTENRERLMQIGGNITASAANTALNEFFPSYIVKYLQPNFVAPKPTPKWISDITDPLVTPVVQGAAQEATALARRAAPLVYGVSILAILTLFGAGYILGNSVGKKRVLHP